jgi:hypothetical protein
MLSSMFLNVTTLLPSLVWLVTASRGGNICFNILTSRSPSFDVNPSNIKCGYDSLAVPLELFGISCRKTTLWREKETVGPCGKCDNVKAVGTPRCSCSRTMSESPDACADWTRFGKIRLPLFKRIDVGSNKRISFAKAERRVDGSREVVTRTRGSTIPDN